MNMIYKFDKICILDGDVFVITAFLHIVKLIKACDLLILEVLRDPNRYFQYCAIFYNDKNCNYISLSK